MLKSLYLRNFRKVEDRRIDFDSGVTGIFGPNYTGKTTTLLALAVAFGGPAAARGVSLVRWGETNFLVQLTFLVEGREYTVERTKDNAKLWRDEELVANKQTNVNAEISKLLGMSVQDWLELRFVGQKQAANMFEAGATRLNKLIEQVTGVATLTQVVDKLGSLLVQTNYSLEAQKKLLLSEEALKELDHDLKDNDEKQVQYKKKEVEAKTNEIFLGSRIKEITQQCVAAQDEVRRVREQLKEKASALEDLNSAKLAKSVAERDLADKPTPAVVLTEQLQAAEQELVALRGKQAEYEKVSDRLETAKSKVQTKQTELTNLKKGEVSAALIKNVEAEQAQKTQHLEDLSAQQTQLTYKIAQLEAEQTSLAEAIRGSACPTCKRKYEGQSDEHIDTIKARLNTEIPEAITAARTTLTSVMERVTLTRRALTEIKTQLQDHSNLAAKIAEKERTLQDLLAEVTPLETRLAELAKEVSPDTKQQVKALENKVSETSADLRIREAADRKLAKAVDALQVAEQGYAKWAALELPANTDELTEKAHALQVELQSNQSRLLAATEALKAASAMLTQLAAQRETLGTLFARHAAAFSEVQELQAQAGTAQGLQKYLRDNRSRYVQAAWTLILGRASAFVEGVSGGAMTSITRNDDGQFHFVEQEHQVGVADASGAQGALVGMGIQIALAESLPAKLNVMVLDEPTADMDSNHASASLLALSSLCSQAIVVSHNRFDEALCKTIVEL